MKVLFHLFLLALLFLVLPIVLATTIDLPEIVAIHFNALGVADGWSSSFEFRACIISYTGLVNLILAASIISLNFISPKYINLPHKDYWFHPDRKKQAMLHIYENGLWVTIIFNLFATLLIMLIADANTRIPPRLDLYVTIMGVILFAGGLVYIAVRLYHAFCVIPESSEAGET